MNLWTLMYEIPRFLDSFGYLLMNYQSERDAQCAARCSKNAFHPIKAIVSGLIATMLEYARVHNYERNAWSFKLVKHFSAEFL